MYLLNESDEVTDLFYRLVNIDGVIISFRFNIYTSLFKFTNLFSNIYIELDSNQLGLSTGNPRIYSSKLIELLKSL